MRKIITAILLICIALTAALPTTAFAKIGDIIGYAKYTDISAYINHYPIASYNINDYTAIVAEDLQNYGFNVVWNGNNRSLSITRNNAATAITPADTICKYASKAGQNSFPYVETDITTYVNGQKVDSFNINGKTCIYIDSLAPYGNVVWVPEIRAIKMWINGLPMTEYAPLADISTVGEVYAKNSGKGDSVISNITPANGIYRAYFTHSGNLNFIVWQYDSNGNKELLVNEIGNYNGYVLLKGSAPYTLEITADGTWSYRIEKLPTANQTVFTGKGDFVTPVFGLKNQTWQFTHNGAANFIVWAYSGNNSELLVNEIGNYNGKKIIDFSAGNNVHFEIIADGNWTLTPQ